jgi:molybdopterin synthase sulfur carrier subunit
VLVRLYAKLRETANTSKVEIPIEAGQTVGDILNALVTQYPALDSAIWNSDGSLAGHVVVILNGRNIHHIGGIGIPLSNDDLLDVFPPVGGGSGQNDLTRATVKFTGHIRTQVGVVQTEIAFKGNTLRQFIPVIIQNFDIADMLMKGDELKPSIRVVINGRLSDLIGGWDAPIPDGSMVVLIHANYKLGQFILDN